MSCSVSLLMIWRKTLKASGLSLDDIKMSGRASVQGCHSEGPKEAGEMDQEEPQEIQQGQMQSPAPWMV